MWEGENEKRFWGWGVKKRGGIAARLRLRLRLKVVGDEGGCVEQGRRRGQPRGHAIYATQSDQDVE